MARRPEAQHLAKQVTMRQLEIFLTVAELGGVVQAAEKLHLSQPSVSIQLRKLTETLGLPLYEIVGRQLTLTEAGHRMQDTCREVLDTFDRLDCDINDLKGLRAGRLRLAVDPSAKYFLPQLLGPFMAQYPGIDVDFVEGKRSDLLERLNEDRDDLYIFNHLPTGLDINHFPFLPNPLVVVANKEHALAKKKQLGLSQLSEERMLLRGQGSGSRLALDEFLTAQNIKLNRTMELDSSEAIRLSVKAGIGVGVLSAYALVNAHTEGLVKLNVKGFPLTTHWHIIHRRQKKLSTVAASFLQFVLDEAEQHLPMEQIHARMQQAVH
ncbi:LysR family transcriptional regulator [Halioglobus maricola]|uniref:LysR family transcriptional regulator n=1 Tax=Halioglobus maricola TaxID=2601894 RepID=A0A5P9NN15_9GAMM|nr:LysR family transcriptional regulator [Halioglobus maricola]QFU77211.1 LysR family transcriptional regulator [Halioglobus maricola]